MDHEEVLRAIMEDHTSRNSWTDSVNKSERPLAKNTIFESINLAKLKLANLSIPRLPTIHLDPFTKAELKQVRFSKSKKKRHIKKAYKDKRNWEKVCPRKITRIPGLPSPGWGMPEIRPKILLSEPVYWEFMHYMNNQKSQVNRQNFLASRSIFDDALRVF